MAPTEKSRDFDQMLAHNGWESLSPLDPEIFQINLGKLCNMSCKHCHVGAGPDRSEMMNRETVDYCLRALDKTDCHTVDITGGAPELNPNFKYLVEESFKRKKHVIDRCNLTVLLMDDKKDLPQWLARHEVEIVCSLPHYRKRNTDTLRGEGTHLKSIKAIKMLNEAGYGKGDPKRVLTIMSNPSGAFLSPDQSIVEKEWKSSLKKNHGVTFDRLITLNNMPIARYLDWLKRSDNLEGYMQRLCESFNPAAIEGLMCRNTISVSWDGKVYDCDFNQMLDIRSSKGNRYFEVKNFYLEDFLKRSIKTDNHCFGCTAGCGSSCSGKTST